jgi:hypothetical protein
VQDSSLDALIDLLLTVGYIDGLFHQHEQAFVRQYLDRLVEHVAQEPGTADAWRAHFDGVYARLDAEIAALVAEVVATDDDAFVQTRLKVRAVALFRAFSPSEQKSALDLLDALIHADGMVSPPERHLQEELLGYFQATVAPAATAAPAAPMRIDPPQPLELASLGHPLLEALEQRYATDPTALRAQVTADYNLIFGAITAWERQRATGNGRLHGVTDVDQLPAGTRFLDGHVHVMRPDRPVELVVLGDLHGCYACLKAALLQSDFIARVERHQQDPANHPDIKLVLLGDYIDRGRFSFEGVLRAALQLLVAYPDHVVLLRGNHEFLVRVDGQVISAVKPAEAIPQLATRAPGDVLEAYRHLFEHMPTSFLFERTLFVHAGIPRDDTLAERYRDLSSLDDAVLRFEMMWSDPVDTDQVPVELQAESSRFSFGRHQFRAFMERTGCHTLIRGHEQVDSGFATMFDLGDRHLHTVFSAGGYDNPDLPSASRYRNVTPMALTIRHGAGPLHAMPWLIRYDKFSSGTNNGLYR